MARSRDALSGQSTNNNGHWQPCLCDARSIGIKWSQFTNFVNCGTYLTHGSFHYFFFERQIWITDRALKYHRATSRTTQSYPSPLGNNAYTPIQINLGKPPFVGIEPMT
ncbi:hypothetical protein Hanom_Chr08g00736491 [Helianthus anomalus]